MVTEEQVLEALTKVFDPEIMINIVDLGLVYDVDISDGKVTLELTLTSPGCPASELIEADAIHRVKKLEGVDQVEVLFVWYPPWDPTKMSDEAKLELGYDI